MTGGWEGHYGVSCSGEMNLRGAFRPNFGGLNYKDLGDGGEGSGGTWDDLVVSNAALSGTGLGGGDYHPSVSSPLRSMTREFVLKYDLAGVERTATDAAGAYAQS